MPSPTYRQYRSGEPGTVGTPVSETMPGARSPTQVAKWRPNATTPHGIGVTLTTSQAATRAATPNPANRAPIFVPDDQNAGISVMQPERTAIVMINRWQFCVPINGIS